MAEYEIDARPYFEILHSVNRRDDDEDQTPEQIAQTLNWVQENSSAMIKVCSKDEWRLMCHVYRYWHDHERKFTPSRKALEEIVRSNEHPKALVDLLEHYDKYEEDLAIVAVGDLHAKLDMRVRDWEKFTLSRALSVASQITVGSWQEPTFVFDVRIESGGEK